MLSDTHINEQANKFADYFSRAGGDLRDVFAFWSDMKDFVLRTKEHFKTGAQTTGQPAAFYLNFLSWRRKYYAH